MGRILSKNYKVEKVAKLKNINVSYNTKIFMEKLRDLLYENGFKKGDYLMGWAIPGAVYAFEGISPGPLCFYFTDIEHLKYNQAITKDYSDQLEKSYFLVPAYCDHTFCKYAKNSDKHLYSGELDSPFVCGLDCNGLTANKNKMHLYKPIKK